ncbi:MAG: ABC transporter permease [bacterium]|nr:ABC transporter permease [bacterium]
MSIAGTIRALWINQLKDIVRNREVLILFFVYPLVAIVMDSAIPEQYAQGNMFIAMFGTMHIVFTPIVAATALIAEEREKHTLKVLMMSNVKPFEYLLSVGGFIFACTMITGSSFIFFGGYEGIDIAKVLVYMAVGCVCSMVIGGAIGMSSRSMTAANATAVPLGLILSFGPMLSSFNQNIRRASRLLYSQQISDLMNQPQIEDGALERTVVIIVNLVVIVGVFRFFAGRQRLEE